MFEDANAICPYFKRVEKSKLIKCEGLTKHNNIVLAFAKYNKCASYRYEFCNSECWRGCPIAQILEENYKE